MLIQGHDDDQLRLSDIARIEKAYEDPTRNEMFYDHERALGILIAASSGSDIIKVGHAVESKLEELKAERLPAGVECHKIFYQPERVGSSLGTFVINLIESVIIVVLILMIAMGFKSGLIIGISLVITVFGSFLFLYSAGGTMQRVSLAAFVLAMGMLVDNAIVIIDGILVDLKAGKKPDGSHDRHRKTDSHASSGRDTDSHYRFSTHLHVPRHRRRLHARPFHRTCRFPVTELDIGTDPCTTDGRPPAASCHRY